ncbi:MAG: hypothetical protein AAFV19_11325 [Pseudomonadota bacterium]
MKAPSTTEHTAQAATEDTGAAPRTATRWKIALNCGAIALCMLAGVLIPSGALASVTAEAVEFFRIYGSVAVAVMAVMMLVAADMMSWPLLTRTSSK